ncbi:hypothetical protein CXB51_034484 [Gossypium anomalum]|uniref:Uncharacterized protein n=1 Tax=Gossypium anomalum TaxID=47600 RepID=A0A8J5Y7V8_9ROSI|nr:hypothetical protein CXB51_034484 [Gossypium anomalum]
MNTRNSRVSRGQKSKNFQGEGPNWILIAGGALLSTLSVRLGYKLKQALDTKQQDNATASLKGRLGMELLIEGDRQVADCIQTCTHLLKKMMVVSTACQFGFKTGAENIEKHPPNGQILPESEVALPLVTVPTSDFSKDNGVMWASSPDRLELPPRPFHHSNCSDSPCVSESGSDYGTAEFAECSGGHSTHLQSQLDAANRDLFDSEREIQRLRKAIADHCVGHGGTNKMTSIDTAWPSDIRNGHANGYLDVESNSDSPEKGRGDGERIEMLKREIGELKEVIEGKEYLLQSYKEQKLELSMKIKELQQRLDSQLPNIL